MIDLTALFQKQLKQLKELGFSSDTLLPLYSMKSQVLAVAEEVIVRPGMVPFLPVIPRVHEPLDAQIGTVRYEGRYGYTDFGPYSAFNIDESMTPGKPYYLIDINDGTGIRAYPSLPKGRALFVDVEALALCRHNPEILIDHTVAAPQSRYSTDERAVCISLSCGRPKLGWYQDNRFDSRWLFPSYKARITIATPRLVESVT